MTIPTPPKPITTLDGLEPLLSGMIESEAENFWRPLVEAVPLAPEEEESPEVVYAIMMRAAHHIMLTAMRLREDALGEAPGAAFNRVNSNFVGDMIESKRDLFMPRPSH